MESDHLDWKFGGIKLKTDNSIFELISYSIDEDGSLPRDFELPNDDSNEGIKFAPGAMDGICMYHMGRNSLETEDKKRLGELIKLAGKEDTKVAEKGFADYCKEHRAITIIDELQECIINEKENLDGLGAHSVGELRPEPCPDVHQPADENRFPADQRRGRHPGRRRQRPGDRFVESRHAAADGLDHENHHDWPRLRDTRPGLPLFYAHRL